jgi:hypothetical protein
MTRMPGARLLSHDGLCELGRALSKGSCDGSQSCTAPCSAAAKQPQRACSACIMLNGGPQAAAEAAAAAAARREAAAEQREAQLGAERRALDQRRRDLDAGEGEVRGARGPSPILLRASAATLPRGCRQILQVPAGWAPAGCGARGPGAGKDARQTREGALAIHGLVKRFWTGRRSCDPACLAAPGRRRAGGPHLTLPYARRPGRSARRAARRRRRPPQRRRGPPPPPSSSAAWSGWRPRRRTRTRPRSGARPPLALPERRGWARRRGRHPCTCADAPALLEAAALRRTARMRPRSCMQHWARESCAWPETRPGAEQQERSGGARWAMQQRGRAGRILSAKTRAR